MRRESCPAQTGKHRLTQGIPFAYYPVTGDKLDANSLFIIISFYEGLYLRDAHCGPSLPRKE
ncbi:hypothetical protein AFERRI_30217 [Acidithiobacillus ferrivorans]|uniref:Uncharacterized protein n=1 Tax=Acidithiobacillus ferrivorans TaxID=160808 RepID=A0A060UMP3_9PROT|nr:hypothetical protein AFERRI_30217 [Acidithiobacillus ferrivorans]